MKFIIPTITVVFGVLSLLGCSSGTSDNTPQTDNELYPEDWSDAVTPDLKSIAITLSKNNILGCGEFYYKTHYKSSSEFLVACTRTEGVWKYYQVWPKIKTVTGPLTVDTTISTPR